MPRREDNWKIKRFIGANTSVVGGGVFRLRRERSKKDGGVEASHVGSFYDGNADSRFGTSLVLPPLNETVTHTSALAHLIDSVHYKGDLWSLFESDYDGTDTSTITMGKYGATSDAYVGVGAPQFNAVTTESVNGDTITKSHVVQSTYGNRCIIAVAAGAGTGATPSDIRYNGVNLTRFNYILGTGGNISIWYLVNPATGDNDMVATWSASQRAELVTMDFWNVDQTTPLDAGQTDEGNDTSTGLSNSVPTLNDLIIAGVGKDSGAGVTAAGTQAEKADISNGGIHGLSVSIDRAVTIDEAQSFSWSGSDNFQAASAVLNGNGVVAMATNATNGIRGFGLAVHKGLLFVLGSAPASAEQDYKVYKSSDGLTFSEPSLSSFPTTNYISTTVTRRNLFTDKLGDIMGFGNYLIVAIYEDATVAAESRVHIGYSTDKGDNWTFNAGLVIPATDTPNIHLNTLNDPFAATTPIVPVLVTSDNVYTLDVGNHVFAEVLAPSSTLSGQSGDALGVARGARDGALYIGLHGGDTVKIVVEGPGQVNPINIGPASKSHFQDSDGQIVARQGHVNAIWGGNLRWLFVAYGGHASGKYAQVFAFDYETGSWHPFFVAEDGDIGANVDIMALIGSTEDDGVARLHLAAEGAAASTLLMFEEYDVNPLASTTKKYKAAGYFNFSEDDLLDPHFPSAVMRIVMDAYDLSGSTSGEHVDVQYGVNGATWTNVSLAGDFLSGTSSLSFGTNGVGVSAKKIRIRLNLKRGSTNTNTPKIVDWELQVRTKSSYLEAYVANISLAQSARLQRTTPETVLSRLKTTIKQVEAVAFSYGNSGTLYVDVDRYRPGETSSIIPRIVPSGNRRTTGIIPVTIEEVVEP